MLCGREKIVVAWKMYLQVQVLMSSRLYVLPARSSIAAIFLETCTQKYMTQFSLHMCPNSDRTNHLTLSGNCTTVHCVRSFCFMCSL